MPFVLVVIAVVAIVAGVALLATSGDRGFADVVPDGLEVALPDDRALTAEDIAAVRFGLAFRGYRMQDVDDVLDRLADEIAERDQRIAALSAEVDTLSRSGRTPLASSTPAPFRPVEETRLPQEAEGQPFTRTETPSPAAEAAAMIAAVTPDPFRAHDVDHAPAELQGDAEARTGAEPLPDAVPAPEPGAAEPLAPSAAVPPSYTEGGAAAAAEAAAQDLAARAAADPVTEVVERRSEESVFTPASPASPAPSPAADRPAAEPESTPLDDATPAYVETVPLPETVTDDPALDAAVPTDPPAATAKPETEPVSTDVVPDLAQPSPEQPAEHRESGPPSP